MGFCHGKKYFCQDSGKNPGKNLQTAVNGTTTNSLKNKRNTKLHLTVSAFKIS